MIHETMISGFPSGIDEGEGRPQMVFIFPKYNS